jgi:hypothetical protein
VYLRDTATKEQLKLEVSKAEYERLSRGDVFAKVMHRGWLGVPYRWAWE